MSKGQLAPVKEQPREVRGCADAKEFERGSFLVSSD